MLFVMGLANSLDGEEEQLPGADEPTTWHIEASDDSDNCTLTYDPDDISDLMHEAYVDTASHGRPTGRECSSGAPG